MLQEKELRQFHISEFLSLIREKDTKALNETAIIQNQHRCGLFVNVYSFKAENYGDVYIYKYFIETINIILKLVSF